MAHLHPSVLYTADTFILHSPFPALFSVVEVRFRYGISPPTLDVTYYTKKNTACGRF